MRASSARSFATAHSGHTMAVAGADPCRLHSRSRVQPSGMGRWHSAHTRSSGPTPPLLLVAAPALDDEPWAAAAAGAAAADWLLAPANSR